MIVQSSNTKRKLVKDEKYNVQVYMDENYPLQEQTCMYMCPHKQISIQ